jgi:hypothetical protein
MRRGLAEKRDSAPPSGDRVEHNNEGEPTCGGFAFFRVEARSPGERAAARSRVAELRSRGFD